MHHLEAKTVGTYRISFKNFATGDIHSFSGQYVELVQGELLSYADHFEGSRLQRDIEVTVMLRKVVVGTDLQIIQDELPDEIPIEACYLG